MRKLIITIMLFTISALCSKSITVNNVKELYAALESRDDELHIFLEPGTYDLIPRTVIDSTLGNAANPDSMIAVTTGLHIVNKADFKLTGKDRRKTIIKTNAGYGIFIEHCLEVLVKNLTITGCTRDQDPNATSGAIVVKNSHTEITGCIIENNQGDFSKTIAGICGIVGRDGSHLYIHNNVIRDNSWDGIALYRKSKAGEGYPKMKDGIVDNLIYNGRGAGIGITWDARAPNIKRNVIHHYWKGIGTFGTAHANVSNTLVRDVRGWGIIASGESYLASINNEVRRCGNVGIAVWDSTAYMDIWHNVICQNGTEKQWVAPLVGIWLNIPDYMKKRWNPQSLLIGRRNPAKNGITNNLFWGNKEADIAYGYKELESGDPPFTFAALTELFGNTKYVATDALNQGNYYTTAYREPLYSSFLQGTDNPQVGIMYGQDGQDNWTWDPDKEPFQD